MSSEKTTALVGKHLEFLGYTSTLQDDGWTFAAHPTRPDLCFRTVPFGIRVVALFDLGKLSDGLRAEWVEFAEPLQQRRHLRAVLARHAHRRWPVVQGAPRCSTVSMPRQPSVRSSTPGTTTSALMKHAPNDARPRATRTTKRGRRRRRRRGDALSGRTEPMTSLVRSSRRTARKADSPRCQAASAAGRSAKCVTVADVWCQGLPSFARFCSAR